MGHLLIIHIYIIPTGSFWKIILTWVTIFQGYLSNEASYTHIIAFLLSNGWLTPTPLKPFWIYKWNLKSSVQELEIILCSVTNITTSLFISLISFSRHTRDGEKSTETIRRFINWEATYGRQLFTSVLRTFSTELGGKSHLVN